MTSQSQSGWLVLIVVLLAAWTLPWKGVALWKSARRGEIVWFIVFCLVNTLGLLEIVYLFGVIPRKKEP